jgi:MoaA/NifB/PqqE/SkfB family radical SAM enzyme
MPDSYNPDYLVFAPTFRCNLYCRHCVIPRERDDLLSIDVGLRVLREALDSGITELAFTGGEPFLYRFFLFETIRYASELGFTFDTIATNGGWWRNERDLFRTLQRIYDCGYRGTFNLSVDDLHQGISTPKRAAFIDACINIFRTQVVKITYTSASPGEGLEALQRLANILGAELKADNALLHGCIDCDLYSIPFAHNQVVPIAHADGLCDASSDTWFDEDFCFSRANVFYVDPQGNVKPCLGYAIGTPGLTIGNVTNQHVANIIEAGRRHFFVRALYRDGLTGIRRRLEAQGIHLLDSPTQSRCFFCHRFFETEQATTYLNLAREDDADSQP